MTICQQTAIGCAENATCLAGTTLLTAVEFDTTHLTAVEFDTTHLTAALTESDSCLRLAAWQTYGILPLRPAALP